MWSKLANVSWKWPFAILLTAEVGIWLHRLYRKYYRKGKNCLECGRPRTEFNKVLFFPDKQIPCFDYLLALQELATAVKIKHSLGARVRVITDTEYMNLTGSKIQMFLKEGIAVRHDRSSYHMHHKFLVIDETIVLTGSFNWTQAAVIGNNENILVTNNASVAASYVREFERLWKKFDAEKILLKKDAREEQTPASGDARYTVE